MSFANALGLEIARVTGLAATVEELPATSDDGERLVTVTFPAVKLMTAIKLLSLFRQGALPTAVRYFGFDMHGGRLTDEPKLLPCPFCGNVEDTCPQYNAKEEWIQCGNCGATGPIVSNIGAKTGEATRRATALWNTRPTQSDGGNYDSHNRQPE